MTNKIMSAMDSDEVNSIEDTGNVEALQVVDIIEDTYYELMNNHIDWNYLRKTSRLLGLADSDFPTTLQIPTAIVKLEKLRYDVSTPSDTDLNYKALKYKDPQSFMDLVLSRKSSDSNIVQKNIKGTSTPILLFNDRAPEYWTSFDEEYITLDAYDSDVESTLQESKNLCYVVEIPTFDPTDDDYVPACPIQFFPTLLSESKKACFFYLKQQDNPTDAQRSMRGLSKLKRKDYRAHERKYRKNYGRS